MEESEKKLIELIPEPKGDKMEVYRNVLLGKGELTKQQDEMFEKYLFADKMLCTGLGKKGGLSASVTASVMKKHFDMSYSNALKIIRESQELLGDAFKSHKNAKKRIAIENFTRLANKAEENDNYEAAISARDKIAKLEGLYDEENGLSREEMLKALFINPTFTTNIQVLNNRKEIDE